jgi:hypothetical protein
MLSIIWSGLLRASWYQYDSRLSQKTFAVVCCCGVVAFNDRCRIMDFVSAYGVAYFSVGVVS